MQNFENKKYDVVGLGNAIVDILAPCETDFLTKMGMEKGVMQLIFDEQAAKALYAELPPATEKSGGSGANTIAGLAALGAVTGFIAKVANDDLGDIFDHDMKASGVECRIARLIDGAATARSMILVTPDADRTMNTYLGASVDFKPEDVDADLIAQSRVLYLEGYLFDKPKAKKAFEKAAEIAKQSGTKVALTLSDPFCVDRHRHDFLDLIANHIDIVFANQDELLSLYQIDDFETALNTLSESVDLVAVTRGADGSTLSSGDIRVDAPAVKTTLIDTTGAGDLYAAGVLYGYIEDTDLMTMGLMGSACAAEIISHMGARPENDLKAYVDNVLKNHALKQAS